MLHLTALLKPNTLTEMKGMLYKLLNTGNTKMRSVSPALIFILVLIIGQLLVESI